MATDDRPPSGPLILRLLAQPQGYDLFQAISLLERAAPHAVPVGESDGVRAEAVRLRAHVSLGFPPGDITSVQEGAEPGGEPYTLRSAVLPLAGTGGPLPQPFTELLLERAARRDHASTDFLDIFHHRFLSFLYRGRKKHRLGLDWRSPSASSLASMLDAVSALGVRRGPATDGAWLRHAGLLGGAPRSMSGLLQLLRDRTGSPVQGRQFVGGWRPLDGRGLPRLGGQLGAAPRLGLNTVLGSRWWDPAAGISLRFPAMPRPRLEAMLPGGADHVLTARLVRRYVQQDVDVTVTVESAREESQHGGSGARLGGASPMRLGWTSWLGAAAGAPPSSASFRLSAAYS